MAQERTKEIDINVLLAAEKECRTRFWSQVCLCVLVCEELFYEVYDICDERRIIRFNNKKLLKWCKESFDQFDRWLAQSETYCLICDYGIQVHKRLEKQLTDLYLTFKFYLERKGQIYVEFKAHILVALTIMHYSVDLYDEFFCLYKIKFGIDLSQDYQPARIKVAADSFNRFAEDIIQPKKNNLSPTKNYASVCAFHAFIDRLLDGTMLDDAGLEVLKLNHKDEYLKHIERESMGIDRLKGKYKLSTNR